MLLLLVFSSPFDTLLALKGLHRPISHRKLVLERRSRNNGSLYDTVLSAFI